MRQRRSLGYVRAFSNISSVLCLVRNLERCDSNRPASLYWPALLCSATYVADFFMHRAVVFVRFRFVDFERIHESVGFPFCFIGRIGRVFIGIHGGLVSRNGTKTNGDCSSTQMPQFLEVLFYIKAPNVESTLWIEGILEMIIPCCQMYREIYDIPELIVFFLVF